VVNDDYEILPHQELEYLRKEVERLKGNPAAMQGSHDLAESMNALTGTINRLLNVLESANDDMLRDYEDNRTVKHMQKLEEQNRKIAEAVVALGEHVKQTGPRMPEPEPQPTFIPEAVPANPVQSVQEKPTAPPAPQNLSPSVSHSDIPSFNSMRRKRLDMDDVPNPPQ
jgi:hypothetical protein